MLISKPDADDILRPVAWLAADVVLAMLPEAESTAVGPSAIPRGVRPPYGTVLLDGPAGPMRLAAFRLPAGNTSAPAVSADAGAFALFDDTPLDPGLDDAMPLAELCAHSGRDPLALAQSLDAGARRRLLDFLLGFCRSAFRLSRDADFASTCAQIAGLCCASVGLATPVADVLPGRVLLRGAALAAGSRLYLVGRRGIRLADRVATPAGEDPGLLLIATPATGDRLLAVADDVRVWQLGEATGLPHVLALGRSELPAARAACLRALAPAAPDSQEAALLRELHVLAPATERRHDDPALPIGGALELALPDGDGGLFLAGWLRDPLELIAGVDIMTPAGAQKVELAALHRITRPDLRAMLAKATHSLAGIPQPGFVARVPDPTGGAVLQPLLRLQLRSGALIELVPPLRPLAAWAARNAVLSSVRPQDARPEILADCLAPAAAGLHRQARAQRGPEKVIRIGAAVARPPVSILVPLYRTLGFLRFQLAAFAEDPTCRASEIIYALDSPEQAGEVEHLLRGLHHLYELPVTLVVMERNGGFAAATNAAARQASGRTVLLLNSDVIPVRPGWLDALIEARARASAVAATAKLLFDDGSLQHAGLYFARDAEGMWFNNHYHKGLPGAWPGADIARRVPGGTGAAVLIERARFEAAGGVCEDYVVGDYEDSDLCLRLQQAGGTIIYEPRAELYHFERRSISLHPGYMRTLACQYNRHLHQRRWADSMAALMDQAEFRPGAAMSIAAMSIAPVSIAPVSVALPRREAA
jgi:GT2 family glycosyltransferase